ncbi:MAG: methionyl-tRNA formyltransferase [Candidatus Eisenbacteria bacterium]
MRVLFAGTPAFALPSLRAIAGAAGHVPAGVLTMPDRPAGRGRALAPPPVKLHAIELGLPVLQPKRPSSPESLEAIASLAPDVIAVVAYGRILKKVFLDLTPHGCLNLHASILPEYRGAAPIERAVQEGRTETGVTIMRIDEGLDTGDILLVRRTPIGPEETAGELSARLSEIGAGLLVEALDRIERGDCPRIPQDHDRATHAPPIDKEEARIDWSRPAGVVVNLVRAMNPRPVAFADTPRGPLRVYRARAVGRGGVAGTVLAADPKGGLVVAAGEGAVRLLEVQLPGKKRMEDRALLSGVGFETGVPLAGGGGW